MITLDRRAAFARALEEQADETFAAHGIDTLYDDQMEAIVADCTYLQYDACELEFAVRLRGDCLPVEGSE